MSKLERKLALFVLACILLLSCILVYEIKNGQKKYDKELYNEIYSEYDQLFDNDLDVQNEQNEIVYGSVQEKTNSSDTSLSIPTYSPAKDKNDIIRNGYKVAGRIIIPKINIRYPIISETTDEYLKIAPTKYAGPELNTIGNFCILGHNYKNEQFFSNLSKLNIKDKVFLTSNKGNDMTYSVYDKYEVNENDLECTNQETNGNIELTLITCTSKKNIRLVVKCKAAV